MPFVVPVISFVAGTVVTCVTVAIADAVKNRKGKEED